MKWKRYNDTEYFVSDTGEVKRNGRILKPTIEKQGYMKLTLSHNSVRMYKRVHRLVAETFIPNPENKPEVNHKDFDKSNNCVDNLEWNNKSENIKYNYDKSNFQGRRKLSFDEVKEIRYLRNNKKLLVKELANKYNVSIGCIKKIIYNETYKNI